MDPGFTNFGGWMSREDTVSGNKADPAKRVKLHHLPLTGWDMEFFSTLPFKKQGQQL